MEPRFKNLTGEPEIDYPCHWEYKAIGPHEETMRAAIAEIMADRAHTLNYSNGSRTGKYCSLLLVVEVESQNQRDEIFVALRSHGSIKMVL